MRRLKLRVRPIFSAFRWGMDKLYIAKGGNNKLFLSEPIKTGLESNIYVTDPPIANQNIMNQIGHQATFAIPPVIRMSNFFSTNQ